MQLVHRCLHNTPARRPSAEELLEQLEAVRAQIEGQYGLIVKIMKVDMKKVRILREKDTLRRVKDWVQLFCVRCLNYSWGGRYRTTNRKPVVSM